MGTMTRRITLVIGLLLATLPGTAQARGRPIIVGPGYHRPFVYDPYWWGYPYPYGAVAVGPMLSSIRTDVTPHEADVFIDGYLAGHASDFNGAFKRLRVVPGGHSITVFEPGFRTVTENVFVKPDSTFKLKLSMDRLPAGEMSAPVPAPGSAAR